MTRDAVAEEIYQYCQRRDFNAPYGILMGNHTNKTGKKFIEITFGRARTLDATVSVYGPKFILIKTSRGHSDIYRSLPDAIKYLDRL
jgi:hypothetical protein